MKRWQYKVINMRGFAGASHENQLDNWGKDGWELVAIWDGMMYLKKAWE